MTYVDGFVLPIPKKNVKAYLSMARLGCKVWREHGALDYHECVGDDLDIGMGTTFPRGIRCKRGETIVFAWIVYRSRAHRDRVTAKVMRDPRIAEMSGKRMPFDMKRMMMGGFRTLVEM